jgi:hypothetical protein
MIVPRREETRLMLYKVTGTNRDTGARMILECDAQNRAAAERKATQSGMGEVLHCEHVQDPNEPQVERRTHRGEFEPQGPGRLIAWAVFLVIVVVAIVMLWPRLKGLTR